MRTALDHGGLERGPAERLGWNLGDPRVREAVQQGAAESKRRGKGDRDRMVPIGARALRWVQRYLEETRPALVARRDDGQEEPLGVSQIRARRVRIGSGS